MASRQSPTSPDLHSLPVRLRFHQRWLLKAREFVGRNDGAIWVRGLKALVSLGYRLKTKASKMSEGLALDPRAAEPATARLRRTLGRIVDIVEGDRFDGEKVARLKQRAIDQAGRVSQRHPDAYEHLEALGRVYQATGEMRPAADAMIAAFKKREQRFHDKGLDKYGFRLIPTTQFVRTIGNTALVENYVRAASLGKTEKCRLILPIHPNVRERLVANPALLEYWSKYIDILEDKAEIHRLSFLDPEIYIDPRVIEIEGRVLPFSHAALAYLQSACDERGDPPLFTLSPEHQERGWKELRRLGLADDDWFVCLHVRTGGYRSADDFREAPVEDYFKAVKEITDRGGWVFRMGDPSMPALPDIPRVVDYARSEMKSDWMDIFLCASCRFFVATSSGLYHLADNFGRPYIQTNLLPTGATFFGPRNMFIPKRIIDKASGRELPLCDVMSLDVSHVCEGGVFRNVLGLELRTNTPEEIADTVVEMIERLDGTVRYSPEDEARQRRFQEMTAEKQTLFGLDRFPVRCRIGRKFLNESNIWPNSPI